MCCIYHVILLTKSRSIVNMTAWGSCTLTYFDHQFLFISGSLKNDDHVYTPVSHNKVANICYAMMTHNINDLYISSNSLSNAWLLFVHKQCMVVAW